MISNLKVDIIYYKTSSDFELEFNLSGCCRMRIFKEKVDNYKVLVNTLARDVSRSRVIIIVTDLIGDKNGVEVVSSAIGYNYESVDKVAHAIKSGDNIKAPRGCLPLVTKSGQYGGCIVECGKQSIIMVSSDRPLRHEVMRSYIHQYIFDINQVEAYNERLRHESEHNPIIDRSNILSNARQELGTPLEQEAALHDTALDPAEPETADELPADLSADAPTEATDPQPLTDEEISVEPTDNITVPNCDPEAPGIAPDTPVTTDDQPIQDPKSAVIMPSDASARSSEDDLIIRSSSERFVAMRTSAEDEPENEPRIDRRQRRKGKATNITLLVIVILLLICFGLLAYFFVYLPITGGELPNDLSKILSEVFKWTE